MWIYRLVNDLDAPLDVLSGAVTEDEVVGLLRAANPDCSWGLVLGRYRDKLRIKDLAKTAGVHHQTVNNGLNTCLRRARTYFKKNGLPAETKATPEEVIEAIREWGSLKARKRRTAPPQEETLETLLNRVLERLNEVEHKVDGIDDRLKWEGARLRTMLRFFDKLVAETFDD